MSALFCVVMSCVSREVVRGRFQVQGILPKRLKGFIVLTPWCRILFEELIVTQLVKKILLSYGTRRFITVFSQAHHWTLS
jgi:hypothetical protein